VDLDLLNRKLSSSTTYTLWILLFFLIPLAVTLSSETASPNCLTETKWIYYIISSPVPKNSRSISKSSPLNLADSRVGKSLNKNKFVYVLGEGAPKEDNARREPTVPSAAELGRLSQCRRCCRAAAPPSAPPSPPRHPPSSPRAVGTRGWLLHWGQYGLSIQRAATSAWTVKWFHTKSLRIWGLQGHLFGTLFFHN